MAMTMTRRFGIIPAYAGSTRGKHRNGNRSWDHPRVCGEHIDGIIPCLIWTGSSPRMRGALCPILATSPEWRIIPAYAGSTSS